MEPILGNTFLPYCWVCGRVFGPSLHEERHHIVPRAYGGVDGPQISLCDSHHSALHEIALKLYSKRPYYPLLTHEVEQDRRLLYLAQVACNSRLSTENDPNKRTLVILSPKADTLEKLKRLKTVYRKQSKEAIFELGINLLYDRHFLK